MIVLAVWVFLAPAGLESGERTLFRWLFALLALIFLIVAAAKLRRRLDPKYAARKAAWEQGVARFEAVVEEVAQLVEQGRTNAEIATRVVIETGWNYQEALGQVKQLRSDMGGPDVPKPNEQGDNYPLSS